MTASLIAFYVLAFIAIASSVFLFNAKKHAHMITALAVTFLSTAGIYVLLTAGIAAVVQIIICAGGICWMVRLAAISFKTSDLLKSSGGTIRNTLVALATLAFIVVLFLDVSKLSLNGEASLYKQIAGKVGVGFETLIIPAILVAFVLFAALSGAKFLIKNDEEGFSHDE